MSEELFLPVTAIKDFLFCPRITYFCYVRSLPRRLTPKMQMGKEEHKRIQELEGRRMMAKYGLEKGRRIFLLKLFSPRLKLSGILDLLIISNKRYFPVEFKFSSGKPQLDHKYQLAAYSLLLEDCFNCPVSMGYLYFHPKKEIFPIAISQGVKSYTKILLQKIWKLIVDESFPDGTRFLARCRDCEFRLFCGDR